MFGSQLVKLQLPSHAPALRITQTPAPAPAPVPATRYQVTVADTGYQVYTQALISHHQLSENLTSDQDHPPAAAVLLRFEVADQRGRKEGKGLLAGESISQIAAAPPTHFN